MSIDQIYRELIELAPATKRGCIMMALDLCHRHAWPLARAPRLAVDVARKLQITE